MLFSLALFKNLNLRITAPINIIILLYIIIKYYSNRTEEPHKIILSINLFVITWLISFIAVVISGTFIIAWLIDCGELK